MQLLQVLDRATALTESLGRPAQGPVVFFTSPAVPSEIPRQSYGEQSLQRPHCVLNGSITDSSSKADYADWLCAPPRIAGGVSGSRTADMSRAGRPL